MAKAARFKVGWSGSGHHTAVVGSGEGMGGAASRPSVPGPRIGPGVEKRTKMEVARDAMKQGGRTGKGMKSYSEE